MLAQRKDREILKASGISAFINIVLNFVLIPKFSYNAAAFTTLLSEFVMLVQGVYYTRKTITVKIGGYIALSILGSFEILMICLIVKYIFINKILSLILSVIISGVVYGLTLLISYQILKKKMMLKQIL